MSLFSPIDDDAINSHQPTHNINSGSMNLTVSNLSNELAKNNSVYISSQLAKDPSRTVNVRINGKILKCTFLPDIDRNTIALSKNLREFLGTDVGKSVRA